jgi:ATP-dependent Lon protease
MTGEISLRGLVHPVGGLKEKLLAAKRAGIRTVIVPERNQPELSEIPEAILSGLNVLRVRNLDQVLALALLAPNETYSQSYPEIPEELPDMPPEEVCWDGQIASLPMDAAV